MKGDVSAFKESIKRGRLFLLTINYYLHPTQKDQNFCPQHVLIQLVLTTNEHDQPEDNYP
ncbi:hypothetical protein GCM10027185_45410 [Spirosoma pulveris]